MGTSGNPVRTGRGAFVRVGDGAMTVSVRAMGEASLQPPVLLLLMLCSWHFSNGKALPTSSGFACFFVFLKAKAHEVLKLPKASQVPSNTAAFKSREQANALHTKDKHIHPSVWKS